MTTKHIVQDSRLWEKGNSILPFATRSQKLAIDLMKTVGVKETIIESFKEGKVLRTNGLNPLSIYQEGLSEKDERILSDLDKNGLAVYHVLLSYFMVGKQTEIQCEHEVSTYEKVISTKSYLCVPNDVFEDAVKYGDDLTDESSRESVTKEYIEHELLMANQGYLCAYVVNDEDGSGDFFYVGVNIFNGEILRVS
jgi:hypothetical protein